MYQLTRFNNSIAKQADPFAQLARDFFGFPLAATCSSSEAKTSTHSPHLDLIESEQGYALHADLPGISDKDLEITVHEGILSILGTRSEQDVEEASTYMVRERRFGEFRRSLKLPSDGDPNKVKAKLTDGVLVISIAKKEERKARKIKLG